MDFLTQFHFLVPYIEYNFYLDLLLLQVLDQFYKIFLNFLTKKYIVGKHNSLIFHSISSFCTKRNAKRNIKNTVDCVEKRRNHNISQSI